MHPNKLFNAVVKLFLELQVGGSDSEKFPYLIIGIVSVQILVISLFVFAIQEGSSSQTPSGRDAAFSVFGDHDRQVNSDCSSLALDGESRFLTLLFLLNYIA